MKRTKIGGTENCVTEIVSFEEAVDRCSRCVLPGDLMVDEILARLPVKSLLQFNSVLKAWRFIINSPEFAAKHLIHQKHKPAVNYLHHDHHNRLRISLISKTNQATMVSTPLSPPFPLDFHPTIASIVGSSNGLVCIKFHPQEVGFGVWNPATRKFKLLPNPQIDSRIVECCSTCVGFSYLPSISSYKLVQLLVFKVAGQQGKKDTYVARVQVLSMGSNCWREVLCYGAPCHELPCYIGDNPQIANGCLHWFGMIRIVETYMVSFDLDKEVFSRTYMEYPFFHHLDFFSSRCKLATFGENLALFKFVSPINIWRQSGDKNENKNELGEYFEVQIYEGMNQSSKKQINFGPFPKSDYPIGSWGNEEMIVGREYHSDGSYAYVYNPDNNDTRNALCHEKGKCSLVFYPYKESLVHV